MRLAGPSRWLWEQYPEEYLDFALLITDLGDVTVLMLLLSVLYWVTDRNKSALLVSYAVAGASVILLLKIGLALPRPDVELVAREYDQYGFPSGHAFSALVVYGGVLYLFERHRDPLPAVATGTLIAAIALSRVVIGVHYLADVIAGVVVGIVFLTAMERVTKRKPRRGFAIGAVLAVPTAAIASGESLALAFVALGTAVGGLAGTLRLDSMPDLRSRREGALLSAVGVTLVGVLSALEPQLVAIHPAMAVVLFAVLTAGILYAPLVVQFVPDRVVAPSGS